MTTPAKILPFDPERRNKKAFQKTDPEQVSTRPAPIITRAIGEALIRGLTDAFRAGLLQQHLPNLEAKPAGGNGIAEIQPWEPGQADLAQRYLLGFSLSLEHNTSVGASYKIFVRIHSAAQIYAGRKRQSFNNFISEIGNRIAALANEPQLAAQFHPAVAQGAFAGIDFIRRYEVSCHRLVRLLLKGGRDATPADEIRIGDSIVHSDDETAMGTVTLFVKKEGQPFVLGAGHLVTRMGQAALETDILRVKKGIPATEAIGTYRFPPAMPFVDEQPAPLDAALFAVGKGRVIEGNNFRRPGLGERKYKVTGITVPQPTRDVNRPLVKVVGRKQRLVDVEVHAINASFTAVSPNGDLFHYDGMLELRPPEKKSGTEAATTFTEGGDSGSGVFVLDPERSCALFAGMIVAGNGKKGAGGLAYALPVDAIIEGLGISVPGDKS